MHCVERLPAAPGPCDDDASPARLLELWQDEDKALLLNDELELDLLSENSIIHQEEWCVLGSFVEKEEQVHCIPYPTDDCSSASLLPKIDLLQYDIAELEQEQSSLDSSSSESRACTFHNYPPNNVLKRNHMMVVNGKAVFTSLDDEKEESPSKRRKVSSDSSASQEYIPSIKDLNLPQVTPNEKKEDAVAKYLQERLDELVQQFQSSYASVMESKQKLQK